MFESRKSKRRLMAASTIGQSRGNGLWHANRALLAAIIRCAFVDARSSGHNIPDADFHSAWIFLQSEAFVDFCDFLGIPSKARKDAVENVRELALKRRGWLPRAPKEKCK